MKATIEAPPGDEPGGSATEGAPARSAGERSLPAKEATMDAKSAVDRLVEAINTHDLDSFVDCFEPDYRSEQPAHPEREFGGREQVRQNWSTLFAAIPDIRAELLRTADEDGTVWAELRIHGHREDASKLDLRGVIINGIRNDRIAWARLYLEEVERKGEGIDETVHSLSKGRD
ncbi:MAG: nuclear transport factor 2 family protein [Actinomycetota bacterium]